MPRRTVDGYQIFVKGALRGDVRFKAAAEMVDRGIYEWTAYDPVARELRDALQAHVAPLACGRGKTGLAGRQAGGRRGARQGHGEEEGG